MPYERLSAQDSMFLHIEKPHQPQHDVLPDLDVLAGGVVEGFNELHAALATGRGGTSRPRR